MQKSNSESQRRREVHLDRPLCLALVLRLSSPQKSYSKSPGQNFPANDATAQLVSKGSSRGVIEPDNEQRTDVARISLSDCLAAGSSAGRSFHGFSWLLIFADKRTPFPEPVGIIPPDTVLTQDQNSP
ncbi:hypothetical protein KM043_008415 [Ampulex compressa]|nr:hypothetical protein KM043_008415 [Ampulex compressa]